MENKRQITSVVIHYEQMNAILESFDNEKLGVIMRAFFDWCFTGKEYDCNDGMIKFAFLTLKTQAKIDFAKYDVIVERRREAGRLGGFKKAENRKQNLANVANATNFSKCKQNVANLANLANNDNVNVNDNNNDNVNDNNKREIDKRENAHQQPTLQEVIDFAKLLQLDEEDARQCFLHYDSQDWITGNGAKIRNWQSKVQSWCLQNSLKRSNEGKSKKDINDEAWKYEMYAKLAEQDRRKQEKQLNQK